MKIIYKYFETMCTNLVCQPFKSKSYISHAFARIKSLRKVHLLPICKRKVEVLAINLESDQSIDIMIESNISLEQ